MGRGHTSSPDLAIQEEFHETSFMLRVGEQEYVLGATHTVVGRGEECDIVVPETLVSRRHARAFVENGEPFIEDLESANGTFVNHVRLHGRTRLFPGDQVYIGTLELEVVEDIVQEDRPTLPVLEPPPSMPGSGRGPEIRHPSSGRLPRRRDSAPRAATVPPSDDAATLELEHAGRLADKMFAVGRAEAGLKILAEPLEAALLGAKTGRLLGQATVDVAGKYAVKLAMETLDGHWVDLAIELHDLSLRPLREETMQQLALLRARAHIGSDALIERYVATLRGNAHHMGGVEMILCERLACLLPSDPQE